MRSRPSLAELRQFASLIDADFEVELDILSKADTNSTSPITEANLDYHGVTTLALRHGQLAEPLASQLAHRIPLAVASEALRSNALLELSKALTEAGLEPLLFKGTALAYRYYSDPWLRPRTDTDLLIEPGLLGSYAQVFNSLGYQKLFAIEGDLVSYQSTYSKALSNQSGLNIDLHWRISNRQILSQSFDAVELKSRSPSARILGFKTLSLVDHVLVACQHRVGHHHREERLTWLYDIHLLLQQFKDSDWQKLTELAADKKIRAITADALSTCSTVFGSAIAEQYQSTLPSLANNNERSGIFLQRDIPEWRLFWYELSALPGLKLKLQWCKETLLPNSAYMRQQMQEESLLKAHLKRLWRGLKRVAS